MSKKATISRKNWWEIDYRWNRTSCKVRANTEHEALSIAQNRAEWEEVNDIVVTEIDAVERRKVVKQLKAHSYTGSIRTAPNLEICQHGIIKKCCAACNEEKD